MKYLFNVFSILLILTACSKAYSKPETCDFLQNTKNAYYISKDGNDYKGDGSNSNPWRTLEFAIDKAKDKSTIIVKPGLYVEQVRIKKSFKNQLLIKAEVPYLSKFTFNKRIFAIVGGASNITIEGFEFSHINKEASPLLVHIDGYGSHGNSKTVQNVTLRNNIFHDSFNNDLLKINNGAKNVTVACNLFYNQGDSDEHIDINSVEDIKIVNNVFFNDFPKSKRKITYKTSSFIVVKDSNSNADGLLGSKNIDIDSNVFLNWQGSNGHGFILIGEDGKPYYEAQNIHIYNNLMLGNSRTPMRSPLGIKGASNIFFFNNTIVGDLPSNAYAIRVNREQKNKINNNINLYNNIWSDSSGTMGQDNSGNSSDFSDVLPFTLEDFYMDNNIIYNGGKPLPSSLIDKINPNDDKHLISSSPRIPENTKLLTPVWEKNKHGFADGSFTISEVFSRLVIFYGIPENKKKVQHRININYIPITDIMGKTREKPHSIGAFSLN